MTDIYEYKAKKYKYKYLKLKRENNVEGGWMGRKTINKYLSYKDIEPYKIDKNKPIKHTEQVSTEQQTLKKKLILLRDNINNNINELYKNDNILGNINYNNILINEKKFLHKINLITNKNTTFIFNINNPFKIININNPFNIINIINNKNIDDINKNNIDDIRKFCFSFFLDKKIFPKNYESPIFKDYMIYIFNKIEKNNSRYYPPILIWFYNLYKTQLSANQKEKQDMIDKEGKHIEPHKKEDTYITQDELYKALETQEKHLVSEFKKYFETCVYINGKHNSNTPHPMCDIFGYCIVIKPYIKNIDYYSLTMIICELYEIFTTYYAIVEDTTINSKRLPELFKELKEKFNNNLIEKDYFLKQLDLIISVIKDI
jgi:hypothetical protein